MIVSLKESLHLKYQYFTRGDIRKLRAIGYTAALTPLEEAVADYVSNYLIPRKRLGE
jgi:ADP-L-glycero-D-manno-heptose 6-epimerase